jgi:hypothetical protein
LALAQVGYREGPGNNQNKYGRDLTNARVDLKADGSWYGELGREWSEWCANGTRWLLWMAGVPVPFGLYLYTVFEDVRWLANHGLLIPAEGEIQPGDLVQFGRPDFPDGHTGIVERVNEDGTFNTVEFNINKAVGQAIRQRRSVMGFYRPEYKLENELPPTIPDEDDDMKKIVQVEGYGQVGGPVYATDGLRSVWVKGATFSDTVDIIYPGQDPAKLGYSLDGITINPEFDRVSEEFIDQTLPEHQPRNNEQKQGKDPV